jgi:hypothetical protein
MTYAERSPFLLGEYVTLEGTSKSVNDDRTIKSNGKELLEIRCSHYYELLNASNIKLKKGYLYYEVKLLSAG